MKSTAVRQRELMDAFGYPEAGREHWDQSVRDQWENTHGQRYRELGHAVFCMERRLERAG